MSRCGGTSEFMETGGKRFGILLLILLLNHDKHFACYYQLALIQLQNGRGSISSLFYGFEDGSKRLLQRLLLRSVQIGGNETARSLHMVATILIMLQCPATVFPTVTIV